MKRLLLVALMVLVTLVGMVGVSSAAELQSGTTMSLSSPIWGDSYMDPAPPASGNARLYYLTGKSFTGGEAITACDSGFHMGSISEIQHPSNLQYDTIRSTPAYDEPSYYQGFGPPSDHMGWVRGSILLFPDYSDFSMSGFDQQTGITLSFRTQAWGDSYMDPNPEEDTEMGWHLKQVAYNRPEPVWCVEDPE
jgi:hypothetical protein